MDYGLSVEFKFIIALIVATIYYFIMFVQSRHVIQEDKMSELIQSMQGDDKHIEELEKKLQKRLSRNDFTREELEAIHRCLTCESCGASLQPSKVRAEESFIHIKCKYCNTLYILKRNEEK